MSVSPKKRIVKRKEVLVRTEKKSTKKPGIFKESSSKDLEQLNYGRQSMEQLLVDSSDVSLKEAQSPTPKSRKEGSIRMHSRKLVDVDNK